MSDVVLPFGKSANDRIVHLIDTRAFLENARQFRTEQKARKKGLQRRYQGLERQEKLRALSEESNRRLKEFVEQQLVRTST
jgi:hypothetical protein